MSQIVFISSNGYQVVIPAGLVLVYLAFLIIPAAGGIQCLYLKMYFDKKKDEYVRELSKLGVSNKDLSDVFGYAEFELNYLLHENPVKPLTVKKARDKLYNAVKRMQGVHTAEEVATMFGLSKDEIESIWSRCK